MKGKINFAAKRKTVTVDVAELDDSITLRTLSVGQITALNDSDEKNPAKQLALAIVDDDGQQVYDPNSEEDLANLQNHRYLGGRKRTHATASWPYSYAE